MKIEIDANGLSTLAVCALRYAMGRQSTAPSTVRGIVRPYLDRLTDGSVDAMLRDCMEQRRLGDYGDDVIDRPGWELWEQEVRDERERRDRDGRGVSAD